MKIKTNVNAGATNGDIQVSGCFQRKDRQYENQNECES